MQIVYLLGTVILSFDIDNTLIPYGDEFAVEPRTLIRRTFGAEPLRLGTVRLFRELARQGHQVWLYTTSYRKRRSLRITFLAHGCWPQRIINGQQNYEMLRIHGCAASKNPTLFGIDLHVDDSEGVRQEGLRYGFETLVIAPEEVNWTEQVLAYVAG